MSLKRIPTATETKQLLEYIGLLKVYLTDDHAGEMTDENPEVADYETLIADIS